MHVIAFDDLRPFARVAELVALPALAPMEIA
jgi:hypothetical protein